MIVKDEAHVIARCLASVRPFIDAWVVVDTGSTDGTEAVVQESLSGLPGRLLHEPWVDFAHNRTVALDAARPLADYVLVIDADEILVPDEGFAWPESMPDAVRLRMVTPGTTFWLTKLMRSSLPWRFEGVLHEYPACDEPHVSGTVEGVHIRGMFDSARNQRPQREKYLADAAVLEQALAADPQNARYAFYLAQSYRDAGELEKALDWYRRRAGMPGWDEETWYALLQVGRLTELLKRPAAEVVESYLIAYEARPRRAEPLYELARYHREAGRFATALVFARAAHATPRPDDALFLNDAAYSWRIRDELSLAAYYTGDAATAAALGEGLVHDPQVPDDQRARLAENLRWFTGQA
jgi:glycosyltransferase involved in cell wall biosynthesis